jgi:hypothetical protein
VPSSASVFSSLISPIGGSFRRGFAVSSALPSRGETVTACARSSCGCCSCSCSCSLVLLDPRFAEVFDFDDAYLREDEDFVFDPSAVVNVWHQSAA